MPDGFKPGKLTYLAGHYSSPEEIPGDWGVWSDGYLSFSNDEKCFDPFNDPTKIPGYLDGTNPLPNGFEGYLTEVGLWGSPKEKVYSELCLEREDSGFFLQQWKLKTKLTEGELPDCHYREISVYTNSKLFQTSKLFNAFEVVYPEYRLHFFITIQRQLS